MVTIKANWTRTLSRTAASAFWITLLLLCNRGLPRGVISHDLILYPAEAVAGEWWRLLTFPLVHVSFYHLLLDGAAFLILVSPLSGTIYQRAWYLFGCWSGNLLVPLLLAPEISHIGLCGLSGIAHGLIAIVALQSIRNGGRMKFPAAIILAGVAVKCIVEMVAGGSALAGLHAGSVGIPVPEAHAGGFVGGVTAFLTAKAVKKCCGQQHPAPSGATT